MTFLENKDPSITHTCSVRWQFGLWPDEFLFPSSPRGRYGETRSFQITGKYLKNVKGEPGRGARNLCGRQRWVEKSSGKVQCRQRGAMCQVALKSFFPTFLTSSCFPGCAHLLRSTGSSCASSSSASSSALPASSPPSPFAASTQSEISNHPLKNRCPGTRGGSDEATSRLSRLQWGRSFPPRFRQVLTLCQICRLFSWSV